MVGIVIVSHSDRLAEGIKELADQMVQGQVAIATAGGVDNPDNPLGTDAIKVKEAILSVYDEDGVVVLMDLGSALLSAETAVDFLDEAQQENVHLCEAPLVEGAIAAAVQAAAGGTAAQVMAEAREALAAKAAQLQTIAPDTPLHTPPPLTDSAPQIILSVTNKLGLHARPAAQFVRAAAGYQSQITVANVTTGKEGVNAKSINQVATLGARQGHEILIKAQGPDADQALAALRALVEANFGEDDGEAVETTAPPRPAGKQPVELSGEIKGIPASPGIAVGPAFLYRPAVPQVEEKEIDDPGAEWRRLQDALSAAQKETEQLRRQATQQVGEYEAAIFDAHLLILQDPDLLNTTRETIFREKINAEAAWQQTIERTADSYRQLEDAYMQARATDVLDVGLRVTRTLTGTITAAPDLPQNSILVAADLTPSDTAQMDPDKVLGICTEMGGATSHSAILARALGIPAVVGVGPGLMRLHEGAPLALDGAAGQLWIKPDVRKLAMLKRKREKWLQAQRKARAASRQEAVTQDGYQAEIAANIRGLADAQVALDYGAEGVGLLRTEFLYLDRVTAPTEEEQFEAYQAVAKVMGTRPLIIRTLDVGGDKPLPYLDLGEEDNPFLGWRGIRLCLDKPEILQTQLQAILRASPGHQIKIMFPMVATIQEVRQAKEILAKAGQNLQEREIAFADDIEVGIMIEIPAAAALAEALAKEVDFFSIGSNDLSQYTMAADRTNARVADLADAFHPAVLRLIAQTIRAGHKAGIWVGLCGELAGERLATPILLGLGLDELSMNGPAIPEIKETIRSLTLERARKIADHVLQLESPQEVRDYVAGALQE